MVISKLNTKDIQGVFSCPCCHCACTKGVQALGSVRRQENFNCYLHYINKIVLNGVALGPELLHLFPGPYLLKVCHG